MCQRFFTLATVVVCLFLAGIRAHAQEQDVPKVEVGAFFSSLTLTPRDFYRTEAGVGGRVTFNLTKQLALEAETTLFPNRGFNGERRATGRAVQSLFGVKAGKRWDKFGVFAKARPGLISFSAGRLIRDDQSSSPISPVFRNTRATHFAFDAGGVLEFYPTRRIVTRFDAGDTIIRYGQQSTPTGLTFPFGPSSFELPDNTRHNFQFSAGIGIRFD